jgi:hypothetical protein
MPMSWSSLSFRPHKTARSLSRLRHSRNSLQYLLKRLKTRRVDPVVWAKPVLLKVVLIAAPPDEVTGSLFRDLTRHA